MSVAISLKQARRLALAAQGFSNRQPPATIKATHVTQLIERLGILQIDSVNALVRSHYLPLYSRLGNYSQALLDQPAWSRGGIAGCLNTGAMRLHFCRSVFTLCCAGACS